MKYKNSVVPFLFVCLLGMMTTSCSDWLDVKPYDQIGEDELLKSEAGFKKLLNGIYIDLNDENLYGKALTAEMLEVMSRHVMVGDDRNTWGDYIDLSNHNYSTTYWRDRFDKVWDKAYALIANCNKILDNIDSRKGLFTGNNYQIIRGEALALRAFLHFDMLRIFGPIYIKNPQNPAIPYRMKQDLVITPILPANEVMQYIIKDLKEAEKCLENDPVRTEGTQMSADKTTNDNFLRYRALRLNYFAVQALLARAYQYMWDADSEDASQADEQESYRVAAFTHAKNVIQAGNEGIFPFVDRSLVLGTPANPDRVFSSEVLFGLQNSQRGNLHKNLYDPGLLPKPVFTMDSLLVRYIIFGGDARFWGTTDDYRYIANWKVMGGTQYFYKYADIQNTALMCNQMIPLIRLGEMYLIAAETQKNTEDALFYLNELRSHRGATLVEEKYYNRIRLKYEYVRELYGEGQIFFYHKRANLGLTYQITANDETLSIPASDKVFVVPLPDSESDNVK